MIKQIEVRSKSKAKDFMGDVPWAAISIASYDGDWPKLNGTKRMGLLQLHFADTEFEHSGVADIMQESGSVLFKVEHTQKIYDFIFEMEKKDVELILVHCEAGISRSPAIACALSQVLLNGEAKPYFEQYSPNRLVYKKMIQEGIRLGHLAPTAEYIHKCYFL